MKPTARQSKNAPAPREKPIEITPARFKYSATLEITLKQSVPIEVEATSQKEARRLIEQKAVDIKLEASTSVETRKLTQARRVRSS